MIETSFVDGWMIGVPLLIVVALLIWLLVTESKEDGDGDD